MSIAQRPPLDGPHDGVRRKQRLLGIDAVNELWKGYALWYELKDILEDGSETRIQKRIFELAVRIGSEFHGGDPFVYRVPEAVIERYGELSYRMLCRVWDLYLAYDRPPRLCGGEQLQADDGFLVILGQAVLRYFHIQLFKEQILAAAQEWKYEADQLGEWCHFWKRYTRQEVGREAYPAWAVNKWGPDPFPARYPPMVQESEWLDRVQRRNMEARVIAVVNRALHYTVTADATAESAVPPRGDSLLWAQCQRTAWTFHALGGEHLPITAPVCEAKAELIWRFAALLSREAQFLPLVVVLNILADEVLEARRVEVSAIGARWPPAVAFP